jgi:hypothetical protein
MSYRSYKMLTIMGFLALLPDVRRGLARKRLIEWDIFGDALDDVLPVADCFSKASGYYFLLGNRAAAVILDAYNKGLLPMKAGTVPGNAYMARRYINTERRVPDFVDRSLRIVPGSAEVHSVQRRWMANAG